MSGITGKLKCQVFQQNVKFSTTDCIKKVLNILGVFGAAIFKRMLPNATFHVVIVKMNIILMLVLKECVFTSFHLGGEGLTFS